MKAFSIVLVGLTTITVMAAPNLAPRQNGIKKCQDGIQGPEGGYDKRENHLSTDLHEVVFDTWLVEADCKKDCYLKENADGDDKGNACLGICINVGHPAPIFTCRGKWPSS